MASPDIKFVCKDEVSKLLENVIQELKDTYSLNPDSSFHPSQITECPRRIIYRARGTKMTEDSTFDSLRLESFKNRWISVLEKIRSIKVLHKDVIASDCNYNLYAKVDAVINVGGDIFAVKPFSVCEKDFEEIRNKGAMKKHVIEMAVYTWLLEVDGSCLIYENEECSDFCVFHIEPYKPIIESVSDKCSRLCDFKLRGQIPNRPYKAKAKECIVCEFSDICWENKEKDK